MKDDYKPRFTSKMYLLLQASRRIVGNLVHLRHVAQCGQATHQGVEDEAPLRLVRWHRDRLAIELEHDAIVALDGDPHSQMTFLRAGYALAHVLRRWRAAAYFATSFFA